MPHKELFGWLIEEIRVSRPRQWSRHAPRDVSIKPPRELLSLPAPRLRSPQNARSHRRQRLIDGRTAGNCPRSNSASIAVAAGAAVAGALPEVERTNPVWVSVAAKFLAKLIGRPWGRSEPKR